MKLATAEFSPFERVFCRGVTLYRLCRTGRRQEPHPIPIINIVIYQDAKWLDYCGCARAELAKHRNRETMNESARIGRLVLSRFALACKEFLLVCICAQQIDKVRVMNAGGKAGVFDRYLSSKDSCGSGSGAAGFCCRIGPSGGRCLGKKISFKVRDQYG